MLLLNTTESIKDRVSGIPCSFSRISPFLYVMYMKKGIEIYGAKSRNAQSPVWLMSWSRRYAQINCSGRRIRISGINDTSPSIENPSFIMYIARSTPISVSANWLSIKFFLFMRPPNKSISIYQKYSITLFKGLLFYAYML